MVRPETAGRPESQRRAHLQALLFLYQTGRLNNEHVSSQHHGHHLHSRCS